MRRPTPGGRRWRRWGWLAPVVACLPVHLAAVGWGLPSPAGPSPDAPAPLASLEAWRRWPGALGTPHVAGHHLLVGAVERLVADVALDDDARRDLDVLAARLRRRAQHDPRQVLARAALTEGGGSTADLSRLVVAGRLVSAALAAAMVAAASLLAGRLFSARVGPLVGLLVGLQPAVVHQAATLDTDGPAAAWMVLSLAAAVAAAGRRRSAGAHGLAAAAGLAAGWAGATRAAMCAAWPGLLAVLLVWRARGGMRTRGTAGRLGAFVVGVAVAFVPGSGLLDGAFTAVHLGAVLGFGGGAPVARAAADPAWASRLYELGRQTWAVAGGLTLVAGLVGWLLASARTAARLALVVLPGALAMAWAVSAAGGVTPRAPLPLAVVLAFPAGDLAHRVLAWARRARAGGSGAAARARAVIGHGALATAVVALVALPGALDVVADKRHDLRPQVMAALAAARAPGERVLLALDPLAAAPWPHPAPPVEAVPLADLPAALAAPGGRPTWVVVATWPGGRRDRWTAEARARGYTPVLVLSPVFRSAFGASVPLQFLVALWRDGEAP